ncbi:hypothetical protein BECAL_00774 [Bellilinea caldifistulae]|uniref:Uncharacterized protein n=1 Tax=Bellilinea caldifistulae TaxID=360411 RepID=A0A0P6XMH4_9CHLR|nr:hypothetical protein [Bellilinea caldifistulae]KPL77583.1 hypothetical protein AC812_03360 [Bellilinea caldifistulae]GAP09624.1 hypothetical protein BECAL_00774 [Bellilinea caldifistulae]
MNQSNKRKRILIGVVTVVIFLSAGFYWASRQIPTWGSSAQEINLALPGDELIPSPELIWNHAITVQALPQQIYPWLVQIGDSRAAFYSITFIENLFCMTTGECHYKNADRIHEEWQNPTRGEQGIIINYLVIQDYQPDEFVLARNSTALPLQWTWLWYVYPIGENTSRLVVRHRIDTPQDVPMGIFNLIMNSGYVMERGMMLGIRERAEGRIPSPLTESVGALIWLLVFLGGVIAAVNFIRLPRGYHALGVGIEVIIVLFILTFIQPPFWLRWVLLMLVTAGVTITFWQTKTMPQKTSPGQQPFEEDSQTA